MVSGGPSLDPGSGSGGDSGGSGSSDDDTEPGGGGGSPAPGSGGAVRDPGPGGGEGATQPTDPSPDKPGSDGGGAPEPGRPAPAGPGATRDPGVDRGGLDDYRPEPLQDRGDVAGGDEVVGYTEGGDEVTRQQIAERAAERDPRLSPEDFTVRGSGTGVEVVLSDRGRERVGEVAESQVAARLGVSPADVDVEQFSSEEVQRRQELARRDPGAPDDVNAALGIELAPDAENILVERAAEQSDEVRPRDLELTESGEIRVTDEARQRFAEQRARERAATQGQQERFGDIDWSFGLGGPEDEVEQTVDAAPGAVRDFLAPKSKKLFSKDVSGESFGHWALSGLGFEERGDQYDSLIRGAGVGIAADVPAGAAAIPAAGLESVELFDELKRNPETATEIPGATAEAARRSYEMAKERPGRTIGALVGGYALAGAPGFAGTVSAARTGAGKAARGAASRSVSRIKGNTPGPGGRVDRGQLDLTGPDLKSKSESSTSPTESVSSVRSPDYDPRVTEGVGRRQTGRVEVDEFLSGTSGRGPRRGLAERREFAQRVRQAQATEVGTSGVTLSPFVGPAGTATGLIGELQGRREMAQRSEVLVDEETADGAGVTATVPDVGTIDDGTQQMEEREEQVTGSTVTTDEMVGPQNDSDFRPIERSRGRTATGQDNGQMARPSPATVPALRATPASDTEPRTTPRTTTPRPSRPRRPRWIETDNEIDPFQSGEDGETSQRVSDRRPAPSAPGWFAETVTDIGTLGTELPGSPTQDELESVSDPIASASELPTTQVLEGDEDVEEAADFLSGGVGLDLDFDLGGGEVKL